MSVNGLRFGADAFSSKGPVETKTGSVIYWGDPQSFHDWEFRVLLKIQILEANEAAARAGLETAEDEKKEREEFEAGLDEEGYEKFPSTEAPKASGAKSPKSSEGATTRSKTIEADIIKDRTNLMSKVMEGLRGDAFLVARDMGINALVADGGLRELVRRIKQSVFPRASEEARELFRIGQVRSGPLSRQPSESMRSYCDRRRRWWRTLQELDSSTSLSEPMRCELLIELSGLTHQEALVIKACAGSPLSFEKVANTLIEHYGSVHLRGGRSLGHQGPSMGSGKGKPSTHKGKGKGRNPWHTGYFAETTSVQDDWEEEFAEDIVEDEEPLVGLLAGADEEEPEEDEYEHEEVEEWESIALNAMADLEGSPDIDASSLGESIQLQIAALAAFGKAKGKKGKGKIQSTGTHGNVSMYLRVFM